MKFWIPSFTTLRYLSTVICIKTPFSTLFILHPPHQVFPTWKAPRLIQLTIYNQKQASVTPSSPSNEESLPPITTGHSASTSVPIIYKHPKQRPRTIPPPAQFLSQKGSPRAHSQHTQEWNSVLLWYCPRTCWSFYPHDRTKNKGSTRARQQVKMKEWRGGRSDWRKDLCCLVEHRSLSRSTKSIS